MQSGKAIFFSSLETLCANNKDIQIYAEKQAKHSPGCFSEKSDFIKFFVEKNFFFPNLKQLFYFTRFLPFNIFL